MTLYKCTRNIKDIIGEKRRGERGKGYMGKVSVTDVTFDFMHYCTKGHREKIFAREIPLPAKQLLCYTSLYYHDRTRREDNNITRSAGE